MTMPESRPWLGVLGGLGPLVSAEFVKTIYEEGIRGLEQSAPRVLLYSDPTFPDRTAAFLRGDEQPLSQQLLSALESLRGQGAARVVICCVTMHHLLPQMPPHLRALVLSLIDVAVDAVSRSEERHLLLCSTGTHRLGLFDRHPRWAEIRDRVVIPSDGDQDTIHGLIHALKINESIDVVAPAIEALVARYDVNSFIAGCTEMHFLAKRHLRRGGGAIDPLFLIARDCAALLADQPVAEGCR
jgi:aspartate racemase